MVINSPECNLNAMATFSGDDIVEWTLIAYYGGLEEDRIFGTTNNETFQAILEISKNSKEGTWIFSAWAVDDAGNYYEDSKTFILSSEDYSGLQHATKIGSNLNIILLLFILIVMISIIFYKKRENMLIDEFTNSPSINPEMMFEDNDLILDELNNEKNNQEELELNFEENLKNNNLELVPTNQESKSTDIDSIQQVLKSEEIQINSAESFAENNGVMLAAEGTIQGKTGWYYDRNQNLSYWDIDDDGNWKRIDTGMN